MVTVVSRSGVDSAYAWRLALVSAFCICLGGGSIYLPVVALKEIAAEFGDRRSVPSLAYLLGFFSMGVGGVVMGWLADRTSPRVPLMIAGVSIAAGGFLASSGGELALYAGYALPLGFLGNAAPFTPAMNNIQGWFERRRSTAVSIISAGPAISGFIWPQVYRWLLPDVGWGPMLGFSVASARCRLGPDACDLRRHCGHAPVRLRLLCAGGPGGPSPRQAPARGSVGPAHAVAHADGSVVGSRLLLLRRHGDALRAHGGVLRRPRLQRRARRRGGVADPGDRHRFRLRHGPAQRLHRPAARQHPVLADPDRLAGRLCLRRQPDGRLHSLGNPGHSLHRHRPGLRADPAPALRADHRRLAAGRGHAVRHGRHGRRRLGVR